jgi:hypothetical protein
LNTESPRPEADLELVKAANSHRECGPGLGVDWQSEPHTEFKPAPSYLLDAGFSRYGAFPHPKFPK